MKRIICLIVALLNTLCITLSASAIELSQTVKNDLYSYGIMVGDETGDLRLEENITRAEFCKMICVCLGFKDVESIRHNVIEDFYDVNKNHWAYDYIQIARELLAEGSGNGYFYPDENITVQDSVKIIVTALGYTPKAEKDGYPTGYINLAEEIGLMNKEIFELGSYATRKEVAYLIYNSLDIPLMQITSFGKDIKYTIMDGTDNLPLITLRKNITKTDIDVKSDDENTVPRFNGEEYTGRIVKIANLEKSGENYYFKNSLDTEDTATYVITKDTYVYLSVNTVDLSNIKNDMYAQCWHYTNDTENIKVLKIELMKYKPSGV